MNTKQKMSSSLVAGYILAFALVVGVKLLTRVGEVAYLLWLLSPTAWLLEVCLNEPLAFRAGEGFVALQSPFIISAECAGANFFIISFLSAVLGFLHKARWAVLPTLAVFAGLAYCLTVCVNVFRIVNILKFEAVLSHASGFSSKVVHEAQGVLVYVSFLLLFYFALHLFFKKPYEKLT
jgi:exosortase K